LLSAPTAERYGLTPCLGEINDSCRLELSINGSARSAFLVGLLGRLAPRNVIRSQSRTVVAFAALMIAVSVTIGVQVMITSFRTTVTLWLDQTLQGDIYVAAQGLSATRLDTPLDPEVVAIALSTPLVQSSAVVRVVSVETESGSVDLVAATTDPLLDARILLEGNPSVTADLRGN
jgi:hypothetical protein